MRPRLNGKEAAHVDWIITDNRTDMILIFSHAVIAALRPASQSTSLTEQLAWLWALSRFCGTVYARPIANRARQEPFLGPKSQGPQKPQFYSVACNV